jgi:hypothetical protein
VLPKNECQLTASASVEPCQKRGGSARHRNTKRALGRATRLQIFSLFHCSIVPSQRVQNRRAKRNKAQTRNRCVAAYLGVKRTKAINAWQELTSISQGPFSSWTVERRCVEGAIASRCVRERWREFIKRQGPLESRVTPQQSQVENGGGVCHWPRSFREQTSFSSVPHHLAPQPRSQG